MSSKNRRIAMGLIAALWIGMWGAKASAQDIPAFKATPTGLPADINEKLKGELDELQAQIDALRAAAAQYNAETAEQQTDAQNQALQTKLNAVIKNVQGFNGQVKGLAFNQQLTSQWDTSVVDARGAEEKVPDFGDEIEKSPAAREAHKGYKCVAAHDWPAAIAWFQQGLVKDPNNGALKRLVDLGTFTVRGEKQWKAEENRPTTHEFDAIKDDYLFQFQTREPKSEKGAQGDQGKENSGLKLDPAFMNEFYNKALQDDEEELERPQSGQSPGHPPKTASQLSQSVYGGIVKESWMMAVDRTVGFLGVGDSKQAKIELGWLERQAPKMTQFHEALEALER